MKKQGRERFCEVKLQPLNRVADWIEPFRKLWDYQFDKLDNVLEDMKSRAKKRTRKK
jgi:hypothetical protein